ASAAGTPTRRARTRAARAQLSGERARDRRARDRPAPRPRPRTTRCATPPARARATTPRRHPATAHRHGSAPPSRRRGGRGRSLLESATPVFRDQRLGELAEIPLEDLVEPVLRELDAVVGDAVLRKVVRTDLLRPLAGADLRAACRLLLFPLLLALAL